MIMENFDWKSEIEVIRFADTDVITTSVVLDDDELLPLIFNKL